jgi:hypothetical protein
MALIHSRAPRSVMKHTTPFQGGHAHGHPITRAKSKPPRSQSVRLSRTHTYSVPIVAGCGHTAHVGTCPVCQRVARERQAAHLAAAKAARAEWQAIASSNALPGGAC